MLELNEKNFENEVKKAKVLIVDFWADWCGPCKLMSPVIEGLSEEMKNVSFGKVNVDDNQKLAQRLMVMSIPTFLIFKNGVEVERLIGTQPRPMLKAKLDYLAKH